MTNKIVICCTLVVSFISLIDIKAQNIELYLTSKKDTIWRNQYVILNFNIKCNDYKKIESPQLPFIYSGTTVLFIKNSFNSKCKAIDTFYKDNYSKNYLNELLADQTENRSFLKIININKYINTVTSNFKLIAQYQYYDILAKKLRYIWSNELTIYVKPIDKRNPAELFLFERSTNSSNIINADFVPQNMNTIENDCIYIMTNYEDLQILNFSFECLRKIYTHEKFIDSKNYVPLSEHQIKKLKIVLDSCNSSYIKNKINDFIENEEINILLRTNKTPTIDNDH